MLAKQQYFSLTVACALPAVTPARQRPLLITSDTALAFLITLVNSMVEERCSIMKYSSDHRTWSHTREVCLEAGLFLSGFMVPTKEEMACNGW